MESYSNQWWIQDLPEGAPFLEGVVPTYYLANIFQKLHENKRKLNREKGRVASTPLDPPLVILHVILFKGKYEHLLD